MTVITIDDLSVEYKTPEGTVHAVNDLSFEFEEGEILGIVGESGSGKTTLAKAIQGTLPTNATVTGSIRFDNQELTGLSETDMNEVRWSDISYIAQSAMNALDPVHRVKSQFKEICKVHSDMSNQEIRERTDSLLEMVGLDSSRKNSYPHELSGGQRQRVIIAMSLLLNPSLIIADEPTTGLDVVIQDEILDVIMDVQKEFNSSMILITHDINVVAEVADRAIVMYGGEAIEKGSTYDIFEASSHPYTIGLQNAFPVLERNVKRLVTIPGNPPDLVSPPEGCNFTPRCPFATDACYSDPPENNINDEHTAKCHFTDRAAEFRELGEKPETWHNVTQGEGPT